MCRQSRNYAPLLHLCLSINHNQAMATEYNSPLLPVEAMDIQHSVDSSTTLPPRWAFRSARLPSMPANNTSSKMYI